MKTMRWKSLSETLLVMGFAAFVFVSCGQSGGSGGSDIPTNPVTPTGPTTPPVTAVKTVDSSAVARFDTLTDAQCAKVKALKVFFQHASVGNNLYGGLDDLKGLSGTKYALVTQQADVADVKAWLAANAGWGDFALGNPGWSAKITNFTANVRDAGVGSVANVAMMKFCYIDDGASFATYRDAMLALEAAYPTVAFVWWTMPICVDGMAARDAYNAQVRAYAMANGKWLFDIADIECHDPSGKRLVDANGHEILSTDYASDSAGHIDTALGRARVAKAMWVLLSNIAESR
jgi:hypothetical protein